MKNKVMLDIIKSKNVIIPLYLYKYYKKLNISLEAFILLMYLYNKGEKVLFDPKEIELDMGIDTKEVMVLISQLNDNKLLNLEVIKNDKNIMEEYITLDDFYQKISMFLMDESNNVRKTDESIFEIIEREFGRTLSPIEYEIVKAWIDSGISNELINEALKEATFNGVSNLRYIDKILYEWGKKGIKSRIDVDNNRIAHKEKKEEKVEVFEYNWLEDDDEW